MTDTAPDLFEAAARLYEAINQADGHPRLAPVTVTVQIADLRSVLAVPGQHATTDTAIRRACLAHRKSTGGHFKDVVLERDMRAMRAAIAAALQLTEGPL